MPDSFIGVMDSGMGGVSVLKSLVREMPHEKFVYWGDNKHAPYGTRGEAEIYALTRAIVDRLIAGGAKAIVIACNTATSAAAKRLRSELDMPVFGLEPALKPAYMYAGGGKIAVLATEATLRLEKYQKLLEQYGKNVVNLPCPELVEFVERGITDGAALDAYFRALFAPYADISCVVLGCTHFVWLKSAISRHLPDAEIFDGNPGLARHVRSALAEKSALREAGEGHVELHTTSDDKNVMLMMRRLFEID